jgi:putative SOS response-associated peptidase YedK
LRTPFEELAQFFGVAVPPEVAARYNIAPTQPVATVVVLTADREFRLMRWGLIPHWAKDPAIGSRMINARCETVAAKPAFRAAFRERRCLIMADGGRWTEFIREIAVCALKARACGRLRLRYNHRASPRGA